MTTHDVILRQGQCALFRNNKITFSVCDLGIANGKIVEISEHITTTAKKELDVCGLHVLPGVIDSQVHFREPGLTHKEDLESGTRSALLGGVTTIFDMPNTNPPTTDCSHIENKLKLAENRAHTHFAFFGGAADNNVDELAKMEAHPHCPGIKIFMGSSTGSLLVDNHDLLKKILSATKKRLIIHSEDEERLKQRKEIALKSGDVHDHPRWRDAETAVISTKKILRLAQEMNRLVHILHVSTAEEMEILKSHKNIATVEVLPNHLTLVAPECYDHLGNRAQQNPPIREKHHQEALWKALKDNVVDVIGSDHAPHLQDEKNRPYPQSPSGTPGVQTLLPIMLNHVAQQRLTLEKLVELVCENPRRIFNIHNKGRLQVGWDADITIVDLKARQTITNALMASKCGWTPFHGITVQGWPKFVFIGGELAMADNQLLIPPSGKPVYFKEN